MRRTYRCGGWASFSGPCGALDCEDCYPGSSQEEEEEEALTTHIVIARTPRFVGLSYEIRPGDQVRVTSGFTYTPNGPRTGYLPKTYRRVTKGPMWEEEMV